MEKANLKRRVSLLWRFAKKHKGLFLIGEICILVSYTVFLLLPLNLSQLCDNVLYKRQFELLPKVLINYGILFSVSLLFNFIYSYVWQSLYNKYVIEVKTTCFEKVMYSKPEFLCNMNTGDVMGRIDWDCDQFIHVVQKNVFHFLNSFLLCAGIIVIIGQINWAMSIMLFAAALLPIVLTKFCGKVVEKFTKESREISGAYNGRLFEILKGIREIKLHCARWWAESQIIQPLKKLIVLNKRMLRVDFFVNKGIYLVNLLVSISIYAFSTYLILNGHLTIGLFAACIDYIALMHRKLNWMYRIYLDWFGRRVSIDRVGELISLESEENTGYPCKDIQKICFKDVCFSYNQEVPVLQNVSFEINQGEKVAIVGESGVGKTTILGLLMRFYTPQSGKIYVNGMDVETINCAELRGKIGIVNQDIMLFDESIRYNLELANHYSNEQLYEALEKVGMKEAVQQLPQGLDTKISVSEYGMSGGQKQRLMIARLLLKNTPVIVMDEATSALDIETEQCITKQIANLSSEITTIVISHRYSTIRQCDKIIVINQGRVSAVGTHQQLLETSDIYCQLFANIKEEVVC